MIALLAGIFLFFSCVDKKEFDFNKLSLSNVNPTWVIPLVSDSIGLKSGEYIDFDGDNAVLVLNQTFSNFNLEMLDSLFNLPKQDLNWNNTLSIPKYQNGTLTLNLNYTGLYPLVLPTMDKINSSLIRIDSIFIDNLDLSIKPLIVSDMSGKITTTIYSLLQHENPFVFDLPFPSGQENYHYKNYVLKLSEDSVNGNNLLSFMFNMNFSGLFKDVAGKDIQIGCNAQMQKLKLSKIFAYIGRQSIDILDTFSVDVKGLSGNVQMKDLDIKFEVDNTIGIPVTLNLNDIGVITPKGEERIAAGFKPIYIKPGNINQLLIPVKTTDSIDGAKLTPLFGDIPNKFYYNLNLLTNQRGGKPNFTNFLVPGNKVALTAHIRAPLDISLQDVVFSDTVNFDLASDWRKMIDDLYFRLKVVNLFPLAIMFQAEMLDENNNVIGSLLDEPLLINSGNINSVTSEILNSVTLSKDIPFNKFKLDQLQHTKKVYFTVKANTSENGSFKVKIKKKDFVVFKLGVASTIHLNEVF
jgi:hypothetical protein